MTIDFIDSIESKGKGNYVSKQKKDPIEKKKILKKKK